LTPYELCGGSWIYDFPDLFRAAFRDGLVPALWYLDIGFRTVLHLQKDLNP